ncbi:MAG TPA: translation elongation factor Ts [Actinomycetota bacterium]|nr:translation elongation factor Ts [Actinomycetota bacterium]
MSINAQDVARLRSETGAGMMDCKKALTETAGDFEAAKDLLRTWGLAGVEKRAGRAASEGMVGYYVHQLDADLPPKVGVLVELNCETDFVAKTPDFKQLARDIAMHIAAMEPRWASRTEIPDDLIDRERKIVLESDSVKGKPENIVEKIVEGKLTNLYSGKGGVLVDQVYVKDESGRKTVGELISEYAAQVKENIVVRRFARFRVGEDD